MYINLLTVTMKKLLAFSLVLCFPAAANAQDCDCLSEFRFVKQFIEKNHGGFYTNIRSKEEPNYKAFTVELEKKIDKDPSNARCIVYLKQYIRYLKDHHSNIIAAVTPVNENDPAQLDSFLHSQRYLGRERIPIDSTAFLSYLAGKTDGIEGIYSTADSTYIVALVKNQTPDRDYAAVILRSKAKTWDKGQVKFELKRLNDSLYELISYLRNHTADYEQLKTIFGNPVLNGWKKLFPVPDHTNPVQQISTALIDFRVLDAQTCMVSIRSFSAARSRQLDSAYRAIVPEIKKYPNLIIDVRNNGGGSDANYYALMPLLYTNPIIGDVVDIYNTPDNRKAYADYDSSLKAKGNGPVFTNNLARVKNRTDYTLVPMGTGRADTSVYQPMRPSPKQVAILYNRVCASACESLLFEALYSSKTILVGENSGGYTGYGNVMSIKTPCGNTLNWTTTVYRKQQAYEFTGITPHYRIPESEGDWVAYTQKLLEQKK